MSVNIDLSRFMSEPSDILERLYKETKIDVMTQEDFNKIPLNKNYQPSKKSPEIIEKQKTEIEINNIDMNEVKEIPHEVIISER